MCLREGGRQAAELQMFCKCLCQNRNPRTAESYSVSSLFKLSFCSRGRCDHKSAERCLFRRDGFSAISAKPIQGDCDEDSMLKKSIQVTGRGKTQLVSNNRGWEGCSSCLEVQEAQPESP